MFYHEPEPEERIERIEKIVEKLPEEIDEKLELYFEAYQEDLIGRIERLTSPLSDGVRALLTLLDGLENIESKVDALAEDVDGNTSEVMEIVTSLSKRLKDIRATVHELREQTDDF